MHASKADGRASPLVAVHLQRQRRGAMSVRELLASQAGSALTVVQRPELGEVVPGAARSLTSSWQKPHPASEQGRAVRGGLALVWRPAQVIAAALSPQPRLPRDGR